MKPKVSIITPLHNKGPYIAETIESVLNQSFTDWGMVIVENGSTDNGPVIAADYAAKDHRIRLIEAPATVRGPGAARNLGLRESSGEWVIFLDSDDTFLPGHLSSIFEVVKGNPDAQLLSCDWLQGPGPAQTELKHPTNAKHGVDWVASAIAFTPWVPHAAMVRRDALGEPPWWDESMDRLVMEDHVFWFRMVVASRAAYSPHCGVFYRVDAALRRHDTRNLDKYLTGLEAAIERNLNILQRAGQSLTYRHRRALMDLFLGLLRFDYSSQPEWRHAVLENIKKFRPSTLQCIRVGDATAVAAHLIPPAILHRLQASRRKRR